jgi:hypothetical protein
MSVAVFAFWAYRTPGLFVYAINEIVPAHISITLVAGSILLIHIISDHETSRIAELEHKR